ncbi:voltage-dependent T-type calcium channel subunit alpha-1I-like [Xiphophorus couchianus]|uniref:voltage-dependent T-type calcium channel subunit alpha-1I-like n=1 Tax=Xiphophorus couchianus TaxID=32473 RepID=UPI001015E2D2|nr:voltage-dependent T-type calcium channel subunit alpha-1I-like [Xiphophorus couchianus]XP_027874294.1 voltage-dependent T-type calcium channel subunit alpha-1I-like [Xiphophorus couchianus]
MSEEEEGPGVAASASTQSAATAAGTAPAATKGGDGVVSSSPPRGPSPRYPVYPEEKEAEAEEEGVVQEERLEEEEKELKVVEERDDDSDGGSSDTSVLVVPHPELVPVVFFCLKQTTCPRSLCIRMVCSPWFERVSMMVILLNCVTLGMYQPCENIDCSSDRCQILQAFDAFIYIFFAMEMVIKMVALGIFGRRCYLGDTWNRLDFFIVMAGMVEYSLDLQNVNFTAIRTVRVLRPLKAINRVPSMRILVNLLLDTLPMLGNVLLLCFFVFFIFGIIGVQLWAGLLRNRCYPEENFTLTTGIGLPRPYYMADEDDERPFICSLPVDNGIMSCSDVPARREGGRACCLDKEDVVYRQSIGLSPEPLTNNSVSVAGLCVNWNQYYTRCHTGSSNPHKGAINFDNIAYAWIVIFQVITLEGWVEIMYYVMDAHSFYNFIYFILLIIVGSFFMINLCLVVIATQFSETKQREHQLMQEQRARCSSSSTLASEPGDCYEELFQLVCHCLRKARRQTVAFFNSVRGKPRGFRGVGRGRRVGDEREKKANGRRELERRLVSRPGHPCPHRHKQVHASSAEPVALTAASKVDGCPQCAAALELKDGVGAVCVAGDETEEEAVDKNDNEDKQKQGTKDEDKKPPKSAENRIGCSPKKQCKELWQDTRKKLWRIVESKYFNRGIMMAILINTISMGIEHHEQPEQLTNVLEICNIVFTSMFSMEMILKLTAFGSFNYLRNPYNVFDGIIVIISVCEIVGQSDGGLSVLRTFRLLRVLKLVRFMPALRRQLVVLMKTMDNVATFCMLLMLFIFIFSILGMHIFGCKFSLKTETGDTVPDRKNFDSLLWAIVTVFQILTQEDWNAVLYNGMAATSPLAALYFVALMTFGNYVLFNLLVAILVEGFQAEGDANRSCSDDDRSSSNYDESEKRDSIKLSDPRICTLTPNGHLELGALSGSRGSYSSEKRSFTIESRKSSLMSLGWSSMERRSLSLRHGRSSNYHNWGRPFPPQSGWSRRSSSNSLGRRTYGFSGAPPVGGSLRVRSTCSPYSYHHASEQESLLSHPLHSHHSHHPLPPPMFLSRHFGGRRDRRALSLELPELLRTGGQAPAPPPIQLPDHGRKSGPGAAGSLTGGSGAGSGLGVDHRDCNGKASGHHNHLMTDVFPQVNARKDRADLDEETDYSLCFRIQKMMEVYKPDWCETREDWSVYMFSPQNKFRLLCQSIIAHKLFDYVVLVFIFLNCITVALERPKILQGSLERLFLTLSNYIFTAIFVAEMTVKVVSMGLYLGETAYLRSSWNILDGFLVFVSLIDIVVSMAGGAKILGVLRVLRLLRTLRPLRVISRAPGLKLVVETLITSLKPIGNIVLICCAFFIIFGILGVQLFKGKFYYCVGSDVKNITNKTDCIRASYRWVHHKYNFDNLGQALMSLFVLASKDGWVNIMYHGLDAVGIDRQPLTNNNPWMLLYFISFLLIVSFFVLNMFVGVVVENFHKCRQHQEVEEARRREEKRQRRMEKKRRKAQKLPYYSSYGRTRLAIHALCTSHYLDLVITFIICINVITMSLEHYSQPQSLETALKYCNYFFTSTFVIEASLKLVAFGFRRFFKDRWNQLDLAIVLLSVMGITLEEIEINASLPINPTIIRIMRVLRIARVLKLLKMATGMRALLDTVVQALPQVGNLGLLFMLLFFIYAALGVELFGELVCNADYPCEGMSRHATFENFGMAFLTLFQVSTGDNWNGIMKDTLRECPQHLPGTDYGCHAGLQFISPLYFVSFVLTAQFVLINVVVAVLMKHLDDSNKEAQEDAEMDAEIELELAQGGLCCMMGNIGAIAGATGGAAAAAGVGGAVGSLGGGVTAPLQDGAGGGGSGSAHDGHAHPRCRLYSPSQESQWLDSVSLLIKDSLEGDMIDNLSGSVFHHYCSSPVCKDCKSHPQEVRLAEVEQASLMSEQLSDKSSSPALPDDLSLDEHSSYQLLVRDSQRGSSDSHSSEELLMQEGRRRLYPSSSGSEEFLHPPLKRPSVEQQTSAHEKEGDENTHSGAADVASPVFQLPADFFHPAAAAHSDGQGDSMRPRDMDPSRLASPASWASLRSPGANSRPLSSQHPSHSDSSLATGSSDGSLQAAPDEGLGFGVCPPRHLDLPVPVLCPVAAVALRPKEQPTADRGQPPQSGRSSATQRKQRSHSSSGPGCPQQDCVDPSDEEAGTGTGRDGCHQALCGEHFSETLNSLSLTSLLAPGSLAPTAMKKCNSTGSIVGSSPSARGKDGRHTCAVDPPGFSSSPWIEGRGEASLEDSNAMKSSARHFNTKDRKKR